MSLIRIANSPEIDPEPVSSAEFVAHARIDSDVATLYADDITLKLLAARIHVENALGGRALITSKWRWSFETWPTGDYLEFPLGNLQSISSWTYTDYSDVSHTFESANYSLVRLYSDGNGDSKRGRAYLKYDKSWPSDVLAYGEPLQIEFICGWLTAANVPAPIKAAVELLAGHWWRNREAVVVGNTAAVVSAPLAMAVEALLAPYVLSRC